jgi:prepilin-type N-terminal cleavage/methylation domain-containing protein
MKITNSHNSRHKRGFTIIEILIVVAMASLLIFVVSSFAGNLGVLQGLVSQKLQSRSDIDQALQIMTTQIRSAGPGSNGAYAINGASTSSFSFYSDIHQNGTFERVRYFLGTSTIQEGVVVPFGNPLVYVTSSEMVTTAISNVVFVSSTPLFGYYDSSYNGSQAPMSSPIDTSGVRIVRVSFYADINPGKAPQPLYFTDTIDIRNLRGN